MVRDEYRTYARRKRLQHLQPINIRSSSTTNDEAASLDVLTARFDEIAADVEALRAENTKLCDHVSSLEEKVEALKQDNAQMHTELKKLVRN